MQSVLEDDVIRRNCAKTSLRKTLIKVIGGKLFSGRRCHLKLLHHSRKEDVELFLGKGLTQTDSFSNSKRENSVIQDKLPFSVNEAFRFKAVRVFEVLWVIHDVVEAAVNDTSPWNDVAVQFNGFSCVVRNPRGHQTCRSKTFLKNSIQVMQVWFVIQSWMPVSSNYLKYCFKFVFH